MAVSMGLVFQLPREATHAAPDLVKPEINGGALARTHPSRVVLGALELLLEPIEVRLGLL